MKALKANILKAVAKASEKMAIVSCGKASILDSYQPKVPKEVRQLKNKNNV